MLYDENSNTKIILKGLYLIVNEWRYSSEWNWWGRWHREKMQMTATFTI